MSHGLLVVVGEQMGAELFKAEAGDLGEKGSHRFDPIIGMAQQCVDLKPVTGAEDRGL